MFSAKVIINYRATSILLVRSCLSLDPQSRIQLIHKGVLAGLTDSPSEVDPSGSLVVFHIDPTV